MSRGLSAHAPSRLAYELGNQFAEFRSLVGISDDALPFQTRCKFILRLDGRDICESPPCSAGSVPHLVCANVSGARWMELIVTSDRFEHAHAVWIDPQLLPASGTGADLSAAADSSGPHTLVLHGNLGDHAAFTGVPYAYWKSIGRRLFLWTDRPEFRCLWERNQYCELVETPVGKTYSVRFEDYGDFEDWKRYRPQRIYAELTGLEAAKEDVSPALNYERAPVDRRIVVCDQATWPNRRGYRYLDALLAQLRDLGWEVIYLRNTEVSERQVFCEHVMLKLNLPQTIQFMTTASLFIGYDSGLAHIAAGLRIPSVQFAAATPPEVFKHNNCIYCLEACSHCCTDQCSGCCLSSCLDQNAEILSHIQKYFT